MRSNAADMQGYVQRLGKSTEALYVFKIGNLEGLIPLAAGVYILLVTQGQG